MKVLILDSDLNTTELVCDYLKADNIEYDTLNDGEQGVIAIRDGKYDLVITELSLPKCDGFSLCKKVRQESDIPIIFLSGKGEEADKVRAFGVGADDFITKPFSPTEFIARIKRHIARRNQYINRAKTKDVLEIKNLKIDKNARRVFVSGEEVLMPVKEYELLLFLAENPNIVFSKERLFDRIWGMDAMGDVSTVTVHIQRIREKVDKEYIETVWGAGYRFKI